jgi:hypothetical protein
MTQVDSPSSMLVFKSLAADQAVSEFGPECADYLLCREQHERSAAKNAKCGIARSIHQELAQAYADLRQGLRR